MKKGDILSRLIELGEKDVKYIEDMILNFIIAGKDTTATTLSWFLYLLCKHPSIQKKKKSLKGSERGNKLEREFKCR